MSVLTDFFSRMKLAPRDAEVIFDRDEPVGRPSDLVMQGRRWFGRNQDADAPRRRAMSAEPRTSPAR